MTRRKGREMDKKDKNTVEEDLRQEAKSAAQEENAENAAEETSAPSGKESDMGEKILNFAKSKAKKDKSSAELEEAKKQIEELKATAQRTQADFMNFKRRTEKEKEDISAFANEKIIVELLAIMDNFDRALSSSEDRESSVYKGVEMIKKQVEDVLARNCVEEIPTDCTFDPNMHHAVMQDEGESPDQILEVFQKGYKLKEKVIRTAMVKVSR